MCPELVEHPCTLTRAKGPFKSALAEYVLFGALYLEKQYYAYLQANNAKKWLRGDERIVSGTLNGKTMGTYLRDENLIFTLQGL